jgi:hypothetical protein
MSCANKEIIECPICYDEIDVLKNCVTTECGHMFHCKCLMQNSATNGFSCPMCRSVMAEELEDSDSDDEDGDEGEELEEDLDEYENNALTSFRMFHQQLAGEEVEEEPLQEDEDEGEDEGEDEEPILKPSAAVIAARLVIQGYTMEDLVKCLLIEHEEYEPDLDEYDRCSDRMFGKFRQIISNYPRERAEAHAQAQAQAEGQSHLSPRLRAREEVEDCFPALHNRYHMLSDDNNDDEV